MKSLKTLATNRLIWTIYHFNMKTLDKYTPLNCITDVREPLYHKDLVYIDIQKIKRSKLDIKLKFSNVNETSGYAGDWFLSRATALKGRKKFNNNGRICVAIPFKEFERLERSKRSIYD